MPKFESFIYGRASVADINKEIKKLKYAEKAPELVNKPKQDIFEPKSFADYIGQDEAKEAALIMIKAAKKESRPLPSILIDGEYGLGKTTLAKLIVKEFNQSYKFLDATSANNNPPSSGLYIIDEIHNLLPEVCDELNTYLDSGSLQIIGCTTHSGYLPSPFRSRFRSLHLVQYSTEELAEILRQVVHRKGVTTSDKALENIAHRSRHNARIANMNLMFIFDLMAIEDKTFIDMSVINDAFKKLKVDENGFTTRDHAYMNALPEERAVGVQYISAIIGVDTKTIEKEIEPFLMRKGLVDRTPRGRVKVMEISDVKG